MRERDHIHIMRICHHQFILEMYMTGPEFLFQELIQDKPEQEKDIPTRIL